MTQPQWINAGVGTLASSIGSGDTALTLDAGQGARFVPAPGMPAFSATTPLVATLCADESDVTAEVIHITAPRSSDTLPTIVRAREGTTAKSWPVGTRVVVGWTADAAGGTARIQRTTTVPSGAAQWVVPGEVPVGSDTFTVGSGLCAHTPCRFSERTRITAAQIQIQTASSAGGTARLGIARVGRDGVPTHLIADWGTVAVDGTGTRTITGLTTVVPPGDYVLLVGVGTVTTGPLLRAMTVLGLAWGGSVANLNGSRWLVLAGPWTPGPFADPPPPASILNSAEGPGNPRAFMILTTEPA